MEITPMPAMSQGAQFTLILGFVMPLVVALIQQRHWSKEFKAYIGLMLCFLVSAVRCSVEGAFTAGDLLGNTLSLFVVTITTFHGFWKPTSVANWLEDVTTIPPLESENGVDALPNREYMTGEKESR